MTVKAILVWVICFIQGGSCEPIRGNPTMFGSWDECMTVAKKMHAPGRHPACVPRVELQFEITLPEERRV